MSIKSLLRLLVGSMLAVALITVSPLIGEAQQGAGPYLNTTDRTDVEASFYAEFNRVEPAANWTGDRASCAAGSTSNDYRASIYSRINWYRAMAGVPGTITEDSSKTSAAQQAALMMAESNRLSHTPDPSFTCYTSEGASAAGTSNLALGISGIAAIDAYIEDPGNHNARVGHRNWILHPPAQQMATGDIGPSGGPEANSLYVFDNVFGQQPALRETAGFVAWPPRGYVPGEVIHPRWSFSIRNGDMSGAQVTVTSGGTTLTTPVVHRSPACTSCGSAPFPIVVFEPQGVDTNPELDTTYTVTVTGVRVEGVAQSYTYTVAVLGDYESPSSQNCRQAPVSRLYSPDYSARGALYRLYCAYFLRLPDLQGYDYWFGVAQSGAGYKVISDSFELSLEFETTYGSLTNSEFLNLVYENVMERPADTNGYNYWMPYLQSGELSRGDVMLYFSASQEFKNKTGTN